MSQSQTQSKKLITGADVCRRVSFGRTKLNELVRAKQFPTDPLFTKLCPLGLRRSESMD